MNTEITPQAETLHPDDLPATQATLRTLLEVITDKAKGHDPEIRVTQPLYLERPEDGTIGVSRFRANAADPTAIAQIQRKTWLDEQRKDKRTTNYFVNETSEGLSLTLSNHRIEIDGRSIPDDQNPEQNVLVTETAAIELLEMIQGATSKKPILS